MAVSLSTLAKARCSGKVDTRAPPWPEMRREKTSRYNEYGYLRYHLSRTELECFSNWKNDFMRLFEG
ncbi:hypothetical protein CH063_09622 [Colletotrichum higginsianum]|uniref:Uncharacterized protein n=1 Tax=Colletotrichum higginsianum (strain IMI 349063) TaxID=759273 RepID=H1VEB4_COLHI|nr:hypothetical protein CH063_09622 [Colletotrichum higginsianum]